MPDIEAKAKYNPRMGQGNLDPQAVQRLFELSNKLQAVKAGEKLDIWYQSPHSEENDQGPYPWQVRFHEAGAQYKERAIMGANRSGKTRTGSAEVAIHLTGEYPDWWKGHRFEKPVRVWVGSETNEASRDIVQKALLGGVGGELGTGLIPKRNFAGLKPGMRQCGVNDVVDNIKVHHKSGGFSEVFFKTYDQKRERWQGTSLDLVWFDEEPPEPIYAEGQTRTLDRGGLVMLTFTPLKGVGNVVYKYLNCGDYEGVWMVNATWDDSPHLSDSDKAQMLASLPQHERDARSKGIPTMGQGVVFPFPDEMLMVDPFDVPHHWKRIRGIDFGINHPAAMVDLAIDSERDIVHVIDCYKQANEGAAYHASRIMAGQDGPWVPVAWPHDGMNREKSGGMTLADSYREAGVRTMLAQSARYDDEKGGSQPIEPAIMEIYDLMRSGRFKVFSHLSQWFEEKRMYHRDDKLKVVDVRDDLMAATRVGIMMRRYAISRVQADILRNPPQDTGEYDPTAGYDAA